MTDDALLGPSDRQLDLGPGFVSRGWGKGLRATPNGFEATGECCFVVAQSGAEWMIVHEREIPPEWPKEVRVEVRREVLAKRPLVANECRLNGIIFGRREAPALHQWEGRDAEGNLHGFNQALEAGE